LLWRDVPAGADDWFAGVACTRLPDGTAIAVCHSNKGSLQVWELADGTPRARHQLDDRGAMACTQLSDGTPVAVTGGGVLRVWDLLTGRLRCEEPIGAAGDTVHALACTRLADGTAVAVTASAQGVIRFWDVASGRPWDQTVRCDHGPPVACTRLTDDTPVAVIGDRMSLRVWDLPAGRFRGEPIAIDLNADVLECLRLEDGTSLAIVGSDRVRDEDDSSRRGVVQAWDLASGRRRGHQLTDHWCDIDGLAATLLPDGTPIVVTMDRSRVIRAWDLTTGQTRGPMWTADGERPGLVCARLPDDTPVLVMAEVDVQAWSLLLRP
jgi:WD40 repeat protein